jgi:hypothetical protein
MAPRNFYLGSSLPPLGDLGSTPPLALAELAEQVSEFAGARALVEAVLLGDDLLEREALLAGERGEVAPAVLTAAQARNEAPLPAYLVGEEGEAPRRIAADALWEAYFRHAAAVARRRGSEMLARWVAHEVAMRNALAAERAKALGLEPADYLVAQDLGETNPDLGALVSEWAAAPDPLAGMRVLDHGRWHWLLDHEGWFTFADDEVAAYAAKLMLLHRWHRLAGEAPDAARTAADGRRATQA